ncbi:hypothetical protein JCM21900_001369 [Sporobolomyces salmonicolor]
MDSPTLSYTSICSSYASPCSSVGSIGTHATSPSSVGSLFELEDQWGLLQHRTDDLVRHLLKSKREGETALRAWSIRCQTLEAEVERLAGLVARLEKDREEADLAAVAEKVAHATVDDEDAQVRYLAIVYGELLVSNLPPNHLGKPVASASKSSVGSDEASATLCKWNGRAWVPVELPSPVKPRIDPSKSMSKQDPPPCNAFYLVGHCDVPRCRFCHDYDLTDAEIDEMRRGAKYHLCHAIQNGVECPDGDNCIYGHYCPRGPSCGRQRCAFNDDQHRIVPTSRPILRRRR